MNDVPRNIEAELVADLKKKFVFLSGPRQVGKTTLAKKIIAEFHGQYLVYDEDEDRRVILQKGYLGERAQNGGLGDRCQRGSLAGASPLDSLKSKV